MARMATITGSAPILLVADVVAAANYYRDKVGFAYDKFYGDPPHFCILHRDGHHLMLARADAADVKPHWKAVEKMWNVYFWVDDADAIYEELQRRGAKIDYTIYNAPHGCREFGIQDLDGYDIAFGQVLNPE
jgi:predicted enzyme related to lactoylglutathione lyase